MKNFDATVDQYGEPLYRFIHKIIYDRSQAEDLLQETFIVAYQKRDTFRGESSLFSWLCGIAVNLARNANRKLQRSRQKMTDTAPDSEIRDKKVLPDAQLLQDEGREHLAECVEQLPEAQMVALIEFYFQNQKVEKIAQLVDAKVATVLSRLFHARKNLRECLEKWMT